MAKSPVRVFLDSNVILSGLISDTGAPRIILDILTLGLPTLVGMTGRYNIIEIERNISKKAPKVLPIYTEYIPRLHLVIVPLPSYDEVERYHGVIADKDTPVLASAIKGKADFLVTGDKKHFEKAKNAIGNPCKILSPAEFLDELATVLTKATGS